LGKYTKLELTWIGKDDRPRLEPRILIEDTEKSYHAPHRVNKHDVFDNILIHGDNLLALKALEQEFTGKVKCIYIDPPYNTGAALEYYDDGIEHSVWLSLIRDRLEILYRLLKSDGVFFCSVDSNEVFYLGVLLDELFGRQNRLEVIVWKKSYGGGAKSKFIVNQHEFVLAYAKDIMQTPLFFLPPDPDAVKKYYKYKDEKFETRGPYRLQPLATTSMDERPNLRYSIRANDGTEIWPEKQWQWSKERTDQAFINNELVISKRPNNYTADQHESHRDFRAPIPDGERHRIGAMLFGGFQKCLYPLQKFDSDPERRFAVILENDAEVLKWFKPAKGDFQIHYSSDDSYEPDFIVETYTHKFLCEPKRASEMHDLDVSAKAEAASMWCRHASDHARESGGKPWTYLLIPHDQIAEQMTLVGLAARYTSQ
jgi:hypothetical protein